MDTAPMSLSHAEAAQWNKTLIQEFQKALEKNPATDLLSIFPEFYIHEHRVAKYHQATYAASINLRTVDQLYDTLEHEPEGNLLSAIPKNYLRRINMATGPRVDQPEPEIKTKEPEFRTRLDYAENATIVHPLSGVVIALLSQYSNGDKPLGESKILLSSLKHLLWNSPTLWESSVRGIVVKCNEAIAAKVITGNKDTTEYTSMQYLQKQAPEIPAPRPHGLIALGPFRVIFMTYIPGSTLEQTWPSLSHEGKTSIKHQLDTIFSRLRTPQQDETERTQLGGVNGEGAKEDAVDECALFKGITTGKEFSDLQFSARHYGSNSYVKLLRSFLDSDSDSDSDGLARSVFSHGDIRTANIMVKQDGDSGRYVVTGVIDWEDSGFYPPYYECSALTCTLSVVDENDWYLYLPECVSPLRFPVRWLVYRLWRIHLRTT